ncbi:DUF3600 domain-containing protein [Rossellomorea vietnamensis]|uniref:DUF3600 domain-containing protein n=1 Tax=Rossellomorea vietnamensis TaxID=218284 RepID=UPI00077CCCB4|nr:DUF3600 domain-containing protein [Rossellomorea vietnamensis]
MSNFKEEINKIVIPPTLHERTKMGVRKARFEKGGRVNRFIKKNMVSAIIAASFILPTGAIAYQTLLADEFYGSFKNVKAHLSSATMEGYLLLDAKLTQAQGDMEKEEFKRFKELLKTVTNAKIEYGDENGNIDYSEVPAKQLAELKNTLFEIQPFFDRLNGQKSSKEVLSSDEYEEYIEAIMIYEQTMAKNGMKESNEIDKLSDDQRENFLEAQHVLRKVNEKQVDQ